MKKQTTFLLSIAFVTIGSVAIAQTINLNTIKNAVTTATSSSSSLSKDEIASGLKNALTVGTGNASAKLNKTDGFFRDAAVKILMPSDARTITKNIALIPGGQKLIDDVVFRMNRAAEDAAVTAKPIFINAITSMTITDALSILKGPDDAATNYLRNTSSAALKTAFMPKISESLNKTIIGNISAAQSWKTLTSANNKAAKTIAGQYAGMKTVNTNLPSYVTDKALQGMFLKIADEEKQIRKNPTARINDVLKKVFGSLDSK